MTEDQVKRIDEAIVTLAEVAAHPDCTTEGAQECAAAARDLAEAVALRTTFEPMTFPNPGRR